MEAAFITLIVIAIVGVTLVLAKRAIKEDDDQGRGSKPGEGYHELHSNYSSGLGGQSRSYKVPRDPQEYAQQFIPKDKRK